MSISGIRPYCGSGIARIPPDQYTSTITKAPCAVAVVNRGCMDGKETGPDVGRTSGAPRWPVILMLVAIMALWGGTWPVGRVVSASVNPWTAALLRFALAGGTLVVICIRQGGMRIRPALLPQMFLLGASGIFGYSFLFFTGLQTTDASRAGLIVGCIPACIALCAALIARRWPSPLAISGILISLLGVSIVISRGNPLILLRGDVRPGDLMILGCVFCWTAYTLLARRVMQELRPLVAVTWSCLTGTALILPFAIHAGFLQEIRHIDGTVWAGLVYLGVPATSLAYCGYYHAIHRIGGVAAGIFINLVPLFALLFGWLFLGEVLHTGELAGGLLVISGVITAMRANTVRRT
jgi:drug/metabolite transporter (DMT)-like permease